MAVDHSCYARAHGEGSTWVGRGAWLGPTKCRTRSLRATTAPKLAHLQGWGRGGVGRRWHCCWHWAPRSRAEAAQPGGSAALPGEDHACREAVAVALEEP